MKKSKIDLIKKLIVLGGGAIALDAVAGTGTRSANVKTVPNKQASEALTIEKVKSLIQNDLEIQTLLKGATGKGEKGDNGTLSVRTNIGHSAVNVGEFVLLPEGTLFLCKSAIPATPNNYALIHPLTDTEHYYFVKDLNDTSIKSSIVVLPRIEFDYEDNPDYPQSEMRIDISENCIIEMNKHFIMPQSVAGDGSTNSVYGLHFADNVSRFGFLVTYEFIWNAEFHTKCLPNMYLGETLIKDPSEYTLNNLSTIDPSIFNELNIGEIIWFKRNHDYLVPTFEKEYQQIFDAKINFSPSFNYLNKLNYYQGSTNKTINISDVKPQLKKDTVYSLINCLNSGCNLIVNFGEIPKNMTTLSSVTVKRNDASVSISPEANEYKGYLNFILTSENKFVIFQ